MRVTGGINFLLIGVIVAAILMSATVELGTVTVLGTPIEIENALRDLVMVVVTLVSVSSDTNAMKSSASRSIRIQRSMW